MKVFSVDQNALPKTKYTKVGSNEKPSKKYEKKKAPDSAQYAQSSTGHRGTVNTTVTFPCDEKNTLRVDIDATVDILPATSRTNLTYLLPRINACILLFLVVFALVATNTWAVTLKANIDQVNEDMSLLAQNCHRMKRTFDEVIRRYDESTVKRARHIKHIVEREALSTEIYDDNDEAGAESSNDTQIVEESSYRNDTDQSYALVPEYVQTRQPSVTNDSASTDKIIENGKNVVPEKISVSTNGKSVNKIENHGFTDSDISSEADYEDYESSSRQRVAREKRSNGRGKVEGHKRRQPQKGRVNNTNKRNNCRHGGAGIVAAHFKGAFPQTVIRDGGLVAPWFLDESASGSFGLPRFNLREGKGAVQVMEAGLYYIYAQVYYFSNGTMNSFWINTRQADKPVIHLALCSTIAWAEQPGEVSEVSCHTSVVRYLNANETVFLQQRERNRLILMRDGQTFLGLVRLHSQKDVQPKVSKQ